VSPYADPAKQRRAQAAYAKECRAAWLARQRCVRCKGSTELRIFRKRGTPKPSWSRQGPSHLNLTVLCQPCVRRGRSELMGAAAAAVRDQKNARERERLQRRAAAERAEARRVAKAAKVVAARKPKVRTRAIAPTAPVEAPAPARPPIITPPPAPRRRRDRALTAGERRMMQEEGGVLLEAASPCPVHGRTRAVRNDWGQVHYRCCGRPVA
jgi:hypothetical protein